MGRVSDIKRKIEQSQSDLRTARAEERKLDKEIRLRIADMAKERNEDWYNQAYKKAEQAIEDESNARSRRAKQAQAKKKSNDSELPYSN